MEAKLIIPVIDTESGNFDTDIKLTREEYIDMVNDNFYLLCKVVSSEPMQEKEEKFSNRAKFIYKDLKDRETIVRFVFEEERRIRKKVIG